MSELETKIKERAASLLASGEVKRVVGWIKGEFVYDPSPATFETEESLKDFVYNDFCGANLSKYLIDISKKEGKTAVFLKPCDTYSFNQLVKEHRIKRENVYVIGVECHGKLDNYKLEKKGISGIASEAYEGEDVVFETIYGKASAKKEEVLWCISLFPVLESMCNHIRKEEVVIPRYRYHGNLDSLYHREESLVKPVTGIDVYSARVYIPCNQEYIWVN